MRKASLFIPAVSMMLLAAGCGGSGSSGSTGNPGGVALEEFSATLPDGSPMEIEIFTNHDGIWAGEFAVATETGPYAHQVGAFQGTSENGTLSATCECIDGTEFTLTGRELSNGSLSLTRSDIPGTTLAFNALAASHAQTRADVSFTLTNSGTSGSSGRATISTTPYFSNADAKEYRGKWRGLDITLFMYTAGICMITIRINDYTINTLYYLNYKLSDVGVATATSGTGSISGYNATTRETTKYGSVATLSP